MLSPAMKSALTTVRDFAHGKPVPSYMPFANQQATFDALERRGLVYYCSVDGGSQYNGYALTLKGHAAIRNGTD